VQGSHYCRGRQAWVYHVRSVRLRLNLRALPSRHVAKRDDGLALRDNRVPGLIRRPARNFSLASERQAVSAQTSPVVLLGSISTGPVVARRITDPPTADQTMAAGSIPRRFL